MQVLTRTVAVLLLVAPLAQAKQRPAVLFLSASSQHRGGLAGIRTWRDWLGAGFEIDARGVPDVPKLTDLAKFNVVVVNFLPGLSADGQPTKAQSAFEKTLDQYLRQGGGVVVFCGGGGWSNMSPSLRRLLAPYGASVPEEQIVDPEHAGAFVHEGRFRTNWTEQIPLPR
jgi:hypothetical protein